ncbi:hypothetical protein F5X96DRAFT_685839 [Biscogniauxia mediterranea]|nr:hypothetical protein F5X96DRAFT_685839 [Biscogniauxia mediterranea]
MSLTQASPAPAPSSVGVEDSAHCNRIGDPLSINVTIRQDPLSVTLDGSAVFALSLGLILSLHVLDPHTVALLVGAAAAVLFVHNDYQNYLKLGPGGTPATFAGYLRINWLKLWALRDPLAPLRAGPDTQPASGVLGPLPYRYGPRPRVVGIAPQRQVDQFGSRECYAALRRALEGHARAREPALGLGTSCFEKHGLGLFARYPFNDTCQGEVCHVHTSDHSLHMNLHPDDAREVLAKGWGQRHPLTGGLPFFFFRMPVPRQFTMVYAPRTFDELRVVCRIIEAAEYWVTAEESQIDLVGLGLEGCQQGC